ncbi:MAG: CynX/NimT family MFS transporter [Acidimicrobiia bacterium]
MNRRRIGLGSVLATTMAVATVAPAAFSVLATTLRAEFGVARWQVGALVAAVMGVGALLSPVVGSFSDRVLPRYSTAATLVLAAIGFGAMALAPSYWWLAGAAIFAGLGQALSNPSTNLLIMSHAEVGRRGVLTGVKQGGVQAGNFLAGILLPVGTASALGWRGSIALIPVACLFGLVILARLVKGRPAAEVKVITPRKGRASPVILRLAIFGALLGLAAGSLLTHLPSFAAEAFGWSAALGGLLVAVFGGVGFVARLTAGPISERFFSHDRTLAVMALLTGVAGVALAVAPSGLWLWPTAILIGIGPMAWNVIGNLAVMELSPEGGAGHGSGVMMAGFLGGAAVGAPVFGWSVDLMGTYRPGWLVVAALGLVAAWVAREIRAVESVDAGR